MHKIYNILDIIVYMNLLLYKIWSWFSKVNFTSIWDFVSNNYVLGQNKISFTFIFCRHIKLMKTMLAKPSNLKDVFIFFIDIKHRTKIGMCRTGAYIVRKPKNLRFWKHYRLCIWISRSCQRVQNKQIFSNASTIIIFSHSDWEQTLSILVWNAI